jgi:AFG3 family protein
MKDNKLEKPKPIRKISNKKPPKQPKFNFIWLYGTLIFAFIVIATMLNDNGGNEISFQRFESQMLKKGDVEKIVASRNGDYVTAEVFIKPDSLTKRKTTTYADVVKNQNSFNIGGATAQYQFSYASMESLQQAINSTEKDIPDAQKTPIEYKQNESLFSNPLVQFIIMGILLVVVWLFIMRRMSGGSGGGPGGQIFNIGKSKATLFDKEAQVSVTFNDVAGLEEAKQEVMEIVDF